MSADIKWEAVERGDLKPADKVRLTHENGNVVHGEVYKDGKYIEAGAIGHWASRFQEEGYRFERAVPERTLPTEAGLYTRLSTFPPHSTGYDLYILDANEWLADEGDGWSTSDAPRIPDDLVRLVPVTDVEELRQRIEKTRAYLVDAPIENVGLGTKSFAVRLLDGEA